MKTLTERGGNGDEHQERPAERADGGVAAPNLSFVIVDDNLAYVASLARCLSAQDRPTWNARTFEEAREIIAVAQPTHLISELRVAGTSLFEAFRTVLAGVAPDRVAVVTVYPSITAAARLARMGVAAYLVKPVCARMLLAALTDQPFTDEPRFGGGEWPSLDRTIWEYLSHVYSEAGSIAEAARRLRVEPRSLRRMLSKSPAG